MKAAGQCLTAWGTADGRLSVSYLLCEKLKLRNKGQSPNFSIDGQHSIDREDHQ
jgi:hypothetical protein